MNDYLHLLIGIACAAAGGEWFVRGAVGLALRLRISAGIIGATVAAFATSAPELSVAVQSARVGDSELAFGNALGANVVNVAVILGLAVVLRPVRCARSEVRRDFLAALLVPVLTAGLVVDGELSRADGVLLLVAFCGWFYLTVAAARRARSEAAAYAGSRDAGSVMVRLAAGLGLLVIAGDQVVEGATGLARRWGMDEFLIGSTVVALGTTVPEFVTMVVSMRRGNEEVGLGTVLGSNIFNGLFIVGVASAYHPVRVHWQEVDTALLFGVLAVACILPPASGLLDRRRGIALLAVYVAYLVAVLGAARC